MEPHQQEGKAMALTPFSSDSSYTRHALEEDLRDGFRMKQAQQKWSRDRQVEQLALAQGLGSPAVISLKDGYYSPQKVFPPLKPEEMKLFGRMDLSAWHRRRQTSEEEAVAVAQVSGDGEMQDERQSSLAENALETSDLSTTSSLAHLKDNCAEDVRIFLRQLRSSARATLSLRDVRAEVQDNIDTVEAALSNLSKPHSFTELLDIASRALIAMERGSLTEDIAVPYYADVEKEEAENRVNSDQPSPRAPDKLDQPAAPKEIPQRVLRGAVEVEAYVRNFLLPKAYEVIAIAHTAEWMLQYTLTFLRTTPAINTDEAETRLDLLARCVRLLGNIENFSSILLSLEAKCEEYAGFMNLKASAEYHVGTLLEEVESSLDAILSAVFPSRRSRLLLMERGIQKKLQRALLFLNEIDYSWTPHVRFHWDWKMKLLSDAFHRIHGPIARKYMSCSVGFVDEALYEQVADTRITGRFMGASPIQPKVPRAQQVEYERVTEKLTLQQIGMAVKGLASLVVGEQICMGARYVLRQSTKDFNAAWGFHMDDVSNVQTEEELQKTVAKVAARAKQEFTHKIENAKTKSSMTFLTE